MEGKKTITQGIGAETKGSTVAVNIGDGNIAQVYSEPLEVK